VTETSTCTDVTPCKCSYRALYLLHRTSNI